jgi:YHS domain-containing protein
MPTPSSENIPAQFVTLCGRIFRHTDPAYFPRASHHGRTIYFCTESCLGAFLADADIFYKAHRNSEKNKGIRTADGLPWRRPNGLGHP